MKHIITTLLCILAFTTISNGQSKPSRNSLDPLLDWNDPALMTLTKFKQTADGMTRKPSELYKIEAGAGDSVICRFAQPVSSDRYKPFRLLDGDLEVKDVIFVYAGDKLMEIMFELAADMKPKDFQKAKDVFCKATGDMNPKPWTYVISNDRPGKPGLEWTHAKYKLQVFASPTKDSRGKETGLNIYCCSIKPAP